jgi:hypothetical protein
LSQPFFDLIRAFLTQGARKLTVGRREIGRDAIEEYEHFHAKTSGTLQARAYPVATPYPTWGKSSLATTIAAIGQKRQKKAHEEGEDFDREELACQRAPPMESASWHAPDSHYKASSKNGNFEPELLASNHGPFQKEGMWPPWYVQCFRYVSLPLIFFTTSLSSLRSIK